MPNAKVSIKIPKPLYEHIKGITKDSSFNSVTDYIVFILRDIVYEGQCEEHGDLTPYELRRIKDKLKILGYL